MQSEIDTFPGFIMSEEAGMDTSTPRKQWQCGEYHLTHDPHTGLKIYQRWTCKDPHNCPSCRKAKQQELRERLTPLLDNNSIKVQLIPLSQRNDINKTYTTNLVLHIPGNDDMCYTLVNHPDAIGVPLTASMLDDLVEKAVPPKGKRLSGGLGKIKKDSPAPNMEAGDLMKDEVTRNVFKYVDSEGENITDKELIQKIDTEVLTETQDLDPQTSEQVQYCLYLLEQKTAEIAAKYGVEILFLYTENTYVFINRIDWKGRLTNEKGNKNRAL